MPSNVSRLSMNSYTFAKNTNNELMTGYIKKLYKHMPSSISQGAAPLKEVNPPQNKPKLMRKDSKKKLKGMTIQNFKTLPTASSPTSVLLGKTKALRSCSPMIRFYNTRRYNSSASISSTAIVSKRYNTKPRKRASQPKKATDSACGGNLMDVDTTVKQLISLGPQRSFMSGAHKRSSADPMSGWHHPPDISMLEDAPRANKAAATRHSSLARPVEMRQTRRASQAHPQDKPSTMKPYHWPAASPDHMPPIKKTQSSLDVCMKHGEGQLKNLRTPKTAERVSYNDSNVSNQERHTQLLLQKTKMLQDLLKQKNEQHQQVAKNKPGKSAAKRSSSQIQQNHQNQQQQRGAERRYLPLDYQRAEEMRQKQQREANAKLRQSIDAMAHLDINTPGTPAVPAKLVKNPAQTSLYDLLVGNGRKHKTRQQEDRLQKQYTSNYVWQRHVLNTKKDKLTDHDHEDAYGEKENEDERAGKAAREQEGGSGILFRKPGYEITTPTASAIKMANQQKASKGQKESPLQRHWVNLHYPRYKTSSMGLDPNPHVSHRRAALNSAHTTTEIEPEPEIKEEYNSVVQSAYQKISENSLENFIKKHAESCKHLSGSRRRF